MIQDWPNSTKIRLDARNGIEDYFGYSVSPLKPIEETIATWPETVTSIGVRLLDNDRLKVEASFGLDDLFNLILRRNG